MTVKHLVTALQILLTPVQRQNLEIVASHITDVKARDSIRHGIGYHHAGMTVNYRLLTVKHLICRFKE